MDQFPSCTDFMLYRSFPAPCNLALYGFYRNIPDSIYEAAVVDGANEFQLFFESDFR